MTRYWAKPSFLKGKGKGKGKWVKRRGWAKPSFLRGKGKSKGKGKWVKNHGPNEGFEGFGQQEIIYVYTLYLFKFHKV